jgi:hypothetical protein
MAASSYFLFQQTVRTINFIRNNLCNRALPTPFRIIQDALPSAPDRRQSIVLEVQVR